MRKQNNTVKRIVLALVIVIAVVIVAYQFFRIKKTSVSTITALRAEVSETVDVNIYAVRSESVISETPPGYVVPLVKNGERVATGDTLAAVFSNEGEAQAYSSYLKTIDEIDYYNRLAVSSLSQYADFNKLSDDVYNALYGYSAAVHSGDYERVSDAALSLRSAVNSRRNASGEKTDYSEIITALSADSRKYLAAAGSYTDVYSSMSGYYIAECDGYENLVSYDDVASVTVESVDNAINRAPDQPVNNMGKLVTSFDWYFICNMDSETAGSLSVGKKYTVNLPYSSAQDFRAEVYKINSSDSGRTAVVFRAPSVNAELASVRVTLARIKLRSYEGYRIPNNAIRIVGEERGVYILRNNLVNFRRIDILYSDDEFSIVDNVDSQTYYIRLYDEVITEGTDLYDGKLIS